VQEAEIEEPLNYDKSFYEQEDKLTEDERAWKNAERRGGKGQKDRVRSDKKKKRWQDWEFEQRERKRKARKRAEENGKK